MNINVNYVVPKCVLLCILKYVPSRSLIFQVKLCVLFTDVLVQ